MPFLRFRYPGSVGKTYSSGVDGFTTMKLIEKDVSTTIPTLGTFERRYETKPGGGEYLAREESLVAYSVN
jgi:hypothetical protein